MRSLVFVEHRDTLEFTGVVCFFFLCLIGQLQVAVSGQWRLFLAYERQPNLLVLFMRKHKARGERERERKLDDKRRKTEKT